MGGVFLRIGWCCAMPELQRGLLALACQYRPASVMQHLRLSFRACFLSVPERSFPFPAASLRDEMARKHSQGFS